MLPFSGHLPQWSKNKSAENCKLLQAAFADLKPDIPQPTGRTAAPLHAICDA
jgi:hypothetical protein